MDEVIQELEYSIQSWQAHIDFQKDNSKREQEFITRSHERMKECEKEIWRAELHIAALREAIEKLRNG